MTHTSWKLNADPPTFSPVWAAVAFALLGFGCLFGPPSARAGEGMPAPVLSLASPASAKKDLATTIHVLQALAQDERLAPLKLNLHAKVTSGIAQLSGPVPSSDARKRVIQVVEHVPGVFQVRSAELYVAKPQARTKPLTLPIEPDKPTQTRSASPNSLSSAVGTLTGREPSTREPPRENATVQPDPRPYSSAPSAPPRVSLMAPEAVATVAPPRPPARLTTNPHTAAPTSAITAAIDQLRRRNEHFRTLRAEVENTTVRVFSSETDGEHVMAFAQAITRLPGVERVVVQNASSPSH